MFRLFSNLTPVVKNLLIINVLVFGAMALLPSIDHFVMKWCALRYFTSPLFNAAQLITYMFIHGPLFHLFFNMFTLVMLGSIIERTMGSGRFLTYYLSCGVCAALVQMGVYAIILSKYSGMYTSEEIEYGSMLMLQNMNYASNPLGMINALINTPMVGASGAVYGVMLAFGMLFPNQPLYLFFIPIPIKAKYVVIGLALIELSLGVGSVADNIAHFAHIGGIIAGIALILYWKKKGVFNNHWFF